MAENLDPEVVFQFQEAMKEATDAAKAMPQAMNAMIDAINKAANPIKNNTKEINDNTDAIEDSTDAAEQRTKKDEAAAKAASELERVTILQKAALQDSRNALKSFAEALLSGERGFGKFGTAMSTAGDAALSFGKSLGPLGAILGGIVKGATMAANAMAQQADNSLKATDQLSKMGSAGAFSAEEVRKLGTGLGLASDQLDKFLKPVSSLGSSLISLGGNAADGVKEFQKLAQELQTSRQEYQRLGISQEELIQNTADYINLQTMQGRQITEQMKRDGSLRVAAREYTDNLLELAALTGKDVEAVKKKNELAQSEIETAIQNNLVQIEINRLRKIDTADSRAKADQLEKELKARDKLLQRVENEVGDPALRKGLAKFLATGAITEEVAALKRIGVPIEDFAAKIKQGVDVQDQFMDSLSRSGDTMIENVGYSSLFEENTRKAFGVSAETMAYLAKARDRDEQSQREQVRARIGRIKDEKEAQDPAQVARNKLTEAEIAAKVALDDLVASANPLLKNFDQMSSTVQNLIIAIGVATAALATMALAAAGKAIGGKIGDLAERTEATTTPRTRAGLKGFGIGAVTSIGAGLAADALGRETKLGAGADILGTAAGMAGTGALVGSAIPVVGTAIGAGVGGVLGAGYGLYKNWGSLFGRKQEDENLPVAREQEKMIDAREKYALEQQVLDRNLSDAEKKDAERKLRQIQKQEAQLLVEESRQEIKNASDDLEKEAAMAKSDRAQQMLASLKEQEGLALLERAATDEQKKEAQAMIDQAVIHKFNIEENRANYKLKRAVNDEQKKALQEELDQIKKKREEYNKAIDQDDNNTAQTTSGSGQMSGPVQGLGNLDVTIVESVGGRAKGGPIPQGKVALVGEEGPEFMSGPGHVTNMDQMIQGIKNSISFTPLHKETEELQETFFHADTNVKQFNKELNDFVKDDSAKKLAKQLTLVTDALQDFQQIIDPNATAIGTPAMGGSTGGKTGGIMGSIMSMIGKIGARTGARGGGSGSGGGDKTETAGSTSGSSSGDDMMSDSGGTFGIVPGPDGKILDFIGNLEARGNYNILVGGKTQSNPSLTEMTVGQVLQFQRGMLDRGHESTAVGKYQIIRKTLEGLVKRGVVGLQDRFDQSTQDKAALGLLNVRKREDFLGRKIDAETYANNLAKEWASLPMPDGRSYYAGVGSNKAHASRHEFMTAIQAKTGGVTQGPESGYLATLHGNELIVPIDPSSILVELGKKSATQMVSEMTQKTQNVTNMFDDNGMKELVSTNKYMAELLASKLDDMISRLEISNDTQEKLLKFSQV